VGAGRRASGRSPGGAAQQRPPGLRIRFDLILASSENVYPGQREALEEGFGGRFFTWYGHSELLVLAGECEHSPLAHAFPEYGILELVDEKGDVIDRPGITGEITGTGFNNEVMPLLRYRTGDYAEYAPGAGSPAVPEHAGPACACGRAYPLLTSIRGRWLQEMIIGAHGERISITALNMHSDVFERVRQFQFFQDAPGEVEIRIVRGEGYKEEDTRRIAEELAHKLGNAVRLGVVFLEEIPPTGRGKHRFLIQELPADTPPARRDA
jgi:phenylacetate-CoA ligase